MFLKTIYFKPMFTGLKTISNYCICSVPVLRHREEHCDVAIQYQKHSALKPYCWIASPLRGSQ